MARVYLTYLLPQPEPGLVDPSREVVLQAFAAEHDGRRFYVGWVVGDGLMITPTGQAVQNRVVSAAPAGAGST